MDIVGDDNTQKKEFRRKVEVHKETSHENE